jgi:hypothetical protein
MGIAFGKIRLIYFFREKGFRIIRLFPSYLGGWIRGLATTSGRLLWRLGFVLL